jgi:hypothetical protein
MCAVDEGVEKNEFGFAKKLKGFFHLQVLTSNILKLLRITGTNISWDGVNRRDKEIVNRAA